LIQLQTLDLRIVEIKEQQRTAPALIEAAEAPLRDAVRLLTELASAVEAQTKERRDRERDLEIHEGQTEKLRARLSELKTNKEYQAHLFEIEMANKRKGEIEEQILLLMERLDKGQQEVRQAQARKTEAEQRAAKEKARLETVSAGLVSELAELEQKRRASVAQLDSKLLARYQKLKAARKDLAVAPLRNGICSGCRLQLPPQLVAEVKRSDELQSCTYCQRILYWDGEPVPVPAATTEPVESPDDLRETV
jgi:hypothetical protein